LAFQTIRPAQRRIRLKARLVEKKDASPKLFSPLLEFASNDN
jgi:hypothetical protein